MARVLYKSASLPRNELCEGIAKTIFNLVVSPNNERQVVALMSFDIFMQSSHRSGRTAECSSPFLGDTKTVEIDDPLTDSERSAVRSLLASYGAESPDEMGCYTPSFNDGSSVEVGFKGLADDPEFSSGMIVLHGNSQAITEFLYQIADAGNFIMQPIMDGTPQIVTKESTASAVASRSPEVMIANSANDIATIIASGVEAWDNYRRRAIPDATREIRGED